MPEFLDKPDIIVATKPDRWNENFSSVKTVQRTVFTNKGKMAWELLQRFATIAAETKGEDSAGRAKLELLSPNDVVARACDIAEVAWDEFARRDWLLTLPPVERIEHNKE